ncbi:MAG: hypothetical protein V7K25_28345 [Nostoc sp.]|uniref:hypothetical protein n=1 Tax=Nostoc sp. TaxID=1180 RepID=UPI002FF9DA7F
MSDKKYVAGMTCIAKLKHQYFLHICSALAYKQRQYPRSQREQCDFVRSDFNSQLQT